MQIFEVLFSEVPEPIDKCLCFYDLTWETKTTLPVSVGFSFLGLLTRKCGAWNYGGEKYCRTPLNSAPLIFARPNAQKMTYIFAHLWLAKINNAKINGNNVGPFFCSKTSFVLKLKLCLSKYITQSFHKLGCLTK